MAFKISVSNNRKPHKISSLLGGIICAGMSGFGFYIVLSGKPLDGGIPLIPDTMNNFIGYSAIVAAALFTGLLALYAFYEFFKNESP
ncbi:MAG: hypothetical protein ACFCU6_04050 [Balneolaceae bacterium]